MKKLFSTLLMVMALGAMIAQNLPVRDIAAELAKDPKRSYGNDYPYLFEMGELTPAPEGYEAFYISHYGRHGSRYYWAPTLYLDLDSMLTQAHQLELLTPAGESFYNKLEAALPELTAGWGELTQVGWDQHQHIARTMYERFPEVFKKGGHVYAISSLQGRCVMSMASFCLELKQCQPEIEIMEVSARHTLPGVVPGDKQNPEWKEYERMTPRYIKNMKGFPRDTTIGKEILGRLLKSTEGLKRKPRQIVSDLQNLYTSLPSIGYEGMMDGIVTDEDMVKQWESSNLGSYAWVFGPQRQSLPILQDIVQKAADVIEGRSQDVASLRFGHDTYIGPLTVLMGINGADLDPEDPKEVKNCYQNYQTCKASNIQLVFYRNGSDVLVKCLLNGSEASLPLPGDLFPYYRWSDFQEYYSKK